eukprot:m.480828 g.480828  ORF g.480828 m.480828 type:complete len:239 (+) comp21966_c0_seq1:225-941(+)
MAATSSSEVLCTWLGHNAFSLDHDGYTVVIDPWLTSPKAAKGPEKIDAILVSHSHDESLGEAKDLAQKHNAKVYCVQELATQLKSDGLAADLVVDVNKGGTVAIGGGFRASLVHAVHSTTVGEAAGWVVSCQNGHAIYHTGDTDIFSDMKLISDVHKPDVALVCIGGRYTMGPAAAAHALNTLLPSVKIAVPMRFGSEELEGTPQELQALVTRREVNITRLEPGESFSLTGRSVKDLF